MPRLVVRKVFVLVDPDGETEVLDTPEQMENALERCNQSADFEYHIEQADLMELIP